MDCKTIAMALNSPWDSGSKKYWSFPGILGQTYGKLWEGWKDFKHFVKNADMNEHKHI